MGKKSTPTAPTPPDPAQTANAQASLNRVNQNTPWGSQTYTRTPGADGLDEWTSNITLSPDQQALLQSDTQISRLLSDLGISQAGRVGDALSRPVDYSSLPAIQNNPLASSVDLNSLTPMQRSVQAGPIQNSIDTTGTENLTRGVSTAGIQKSLNADPAALRVQAKDISAGNPYQEAAYRQQTQYLDADYGNREKSLENKLIQQGVLQGTEAWDKAMQNFGRQRTFDYNNAYNNSFDKGLAAADQSFNQELAGNNQYFNQDYASGQFVNSAQGQQYGQDMGNATLNNSAAGQLNAQRLAQADLFNSAQNQQFTQGLANAGLNNSANQTEFGAKLDLANLNNRTSAQAFDQSSAQRSQQLQELLQQQQQPMNILNALRSGSQVTTPQFTNTPQVDYSGLVQNQYNGQMNQYNNQYNSATSARNALVNGLFGLGTAGILA